MNALGERLFTVAVPSNMINHLNTAQPPNPSNTVLESLTPAHITNLPYGNVNNLFTVNRINSNRADGSPLFTDAQLATFDGTKLRTLATDRMNALGERLFTAAVPSNMINQLNTAQFDNLSNTVLEALTPAHITNLPYGNVNNLFTVGRINSNRADGSPLFTDAQLATFDGTKLRTLATDRMNALGERLFTAAVPSNMINQLNTAQFDNLSNTVLEALTPAHITNLPYGNVNNLFTVNRINSNRADGSPLFTDAQLATFDGTKLRTLATDT